MFSPPNYSAPENFLNPRFGPWTVVLYLHRKSILDAVHKASPVLRGRLLDVGCGSKPYACVLQCSEHIGVDVQTSPHHKDHMDRIYDGQTLPFGDAEFDSVLCTEVLEHCCDPQRMVREIWRVLKPGGHALLTVPLVFHHHEEPYDFQRFTRYGMEHLAEQAKFEVEWIRPRGGLYSTAIQSFYCALGYTLSRRPFIDLLLWAAWPLTACLLWFERRGDSSNVICLGWQMLVTKASATRK